MLYQSTRNKKLSVTAAQAIKAGLSAEGGLFVPESIPEIAMPEIEKMAEKWAIERLVPLCELKTAISQGDEAISTLAERFGVTEGFMQKVFEHYSRKQIA